MFMYFVLFLVAVLLSFTLREPDNLIEVRRRYAILRKSIDEKGRFSRLRQPIIITGFEKRFGQIGYNVNKGYEIGLCVDGEPNDIFHVLIHELAHSTVPEFEHSKKFWEHVEELKTHCVNLGIYKEVPSEKKFCGQIIKD